MSICDYCDWNSMEFDELGAIDYCLFKDIYSDQMELVEKCSDYRNKSCTKEKLK